MIYMIQALGGRKRKLDTSNSQERISTLTSHKSFSDPFNIFPAHVQTKQEQQLQVVVPCTAGKIANL